MTTLRRSIAGVVRNFQTLHRQFPSFSAICGLSKCLLIAIEIDSLKRMSEAHDVMGRIPEKWQRETTVQNLQKELFHAIVVARR